MSDPFLIRGPAAISFSGGRTSAYMLWRILQAHGGRLPADVMVTFANTGKERKETHRFIYAVERRWNVRVYWVEWTLDEPGFKVVQYHSASRDGGPFARLIEHKSRLPNWRERWCTQVLKVETMQSFLRDRLGLGPGDYTEVIGMRYDEPWRIAKMKGRNIDSGRRCIAPLYEAKITKPDVMRFWLGDNVDPLNLTYPLPQGFDLGLQHWEGNCDLCFLKGEAIKRRIIRDHPEVAKWWSDQETPTKGKGIRGWFSNRYRIEDLIHRVQQAPDLFDAPDDDEYDAECGLYCGPSEEDAA